MSTPSTPLPQESFADFTPTAPPTADPDNPPWGVLAALVMWVVSFLALALIPFVAVAAHLSYKQTPLTPENLRGALTADPQVILTFLVATIPSHLVTFALAWALVTGFGKRSFRRTLGWGFGEGFGFWKSAGLAVLMLVLGYVILYFGGGGETDIDVMVNSSPAARFTTAFLATVSAPVVEELIYRGVLYSALRRVLGTAWSVVAVSALFALVHTSQYRNNLGVIATIAMLSLTLTLVRARTGRLLPCIVIHMLFNGIQSALFVLQYFSPDPAGETPKQGLLVAPELARALGLHF